MDWFTPQLNLKGYIYIGVTILLVALLVGWSVLQSWWKELSIPTCFDGLHRYLVYTKNIKWSCAEHILPVDGVTAACSHVPFDELVWKRYLITFSFSKHQFCVRSFTRRNLRANHSGIYLAGEEISTLDLLLVLRVLRLVKILVSIQR